MAKLFVLLTMIFCHIVDDYYLQGILSSMKQKQWWKDNAPLALYRYDYIAALVMHAFSWSFMVMLPIAYMYRFAITGLFTIVFLFNMVIHAVADDLKANKGAISLIGDQYVHIAQIIMTAILLIN